VRVRSFSILVCIILAVALIYKIFWKSRVFPNFFWVVYLQLSSAYKRTSMLFFFFLAFTAATFLPFWWRNNKTALINVIIIRCRSLICHHSSLAGERIHLRANLSHCDTIIISYVIQGCGHNFTESRQNGERLKFFNRQIRKQLGIRGERISDERRKKYNRQSVKRGFIFTR
jgi:hypothetical protein